MGDDDKDKTVKVSYYEELKSKDVIDWVRPLIEQGSYRLRFGDGHIVPDTSMHHDPPWHHVKMTDQFDCGMNMTIMHNVVFRGIGKGWIPAQCQSCWKVVAKPQTLLQLFAVEEILKQLGRPGKCGIEVRGLSGKHIVPTFSRYGAYWYNDSLENGRECYAAVRKAIDEHSALGPDVSVLLKRGCTEYEALHGDSKDWKVTPAQQHVEDLVHRKVHSRTNFSQQSDHQITRLHVRWIEFACAVGDETYLYFTGGKPIHTVYRTYHEEEEQTKTGGKSKRPKSKPPGAKPTDGKRGKKK